MNLTARVAFTALLVLLPVASALWDNCNATYSTATIFGCKYAAPSCCRPSECRQEYKMNGYWSTAVDGLANSDTCGKACLRHFGKCQRKCRCLADNTETVYHPWLPTKYPCKCVRDLKKLSRRRLLSACTSQCKKARLACMSGCIGKKCPVIAYTKMDLPYHCIWKVRPYLREVWWR